MQSTSHEPSAGALAAMSLEQRVSFAAAEIATTPAGHPGRGVAPARSPSCLGAGYQRASILNLGEDLTGHLVTSAMTARRLAEHLP